LEIRAAVWRDGAIEPDIETLELRAPGPGEILVRIEACGICHTDIRVASRPGPRPIVLGHEGAGVVEQAGEGVDDLQPGDRVLLSYAFCGACPACRADARPYCRDAMALNFSGLRGDGSSPLVRDGQTVFGSFFGQSAFATHLVCEARQAVKAPDDLALELLAPLGCSIQTGAGAVMNVLRVGEGRSLAVFGTGPVGLSAIMAARAAWASPIIAVETNPDRRDLALELGASHALDPSANNPVGAIQDLTGGGADVSLNTTDVPEVYRQAVACLAPKGVMAFVTGPRSEPAIELAPLLLGGRQVRGVVQGDSDPRRFIPRLIDLHRQGRFPLERMVRTYPFEAVAQAMHDMEAGRTVKPVLLMQS
jgi:aryl-alcohol dehydrogenase